MKKVKIYEVTFLRYTICMNDTVSDQKEDFTFSKDFSDLKYLDVQSPFLIKEADIPYYQKFGGGFKDLRFVGYLGELDESAEDTDSEKKTVTTNPLDIRDFDSPHLTDDFTVNPVKRIEIGDKDFQFMTTTPDYNATKDQNNSVVLDTIYNGVTTICDSEGK